MSKAINNKVYAWGCGDSNLSSHIEKSRNSYYESRLDLILNEEGVEVLLDEHLSSGQDLEFSEDAFLNANSAIGTDALDLLKKQQKDILELANDYKGHVVDGVSKVLYGQVGQIKNKSDCLSDSIFIGTLK